MIIKLEPPMNSTERYLYGINQRLDIIIKLLEEQTKQKQIVQTEEKSDKMVKGRKRVVKGD